MEFESHNLDDTRILAKKVLDSLKGKNVILLKGGLGAGKTTFTQGILEEIGAEGPFTSPTFVVMKDYKLTDNKVFQKAYHLDCYRIGADNLKDLAWEEVISDKKNLVIVEWPERIKSALRDDMVKINIEILTENKRKFIIKNN